MTAEQAFAPFSGIAPYPFDDFKNSSDPDSRPLTLLEAWRGLHKATKQGIFSLRTFDLQGYERFRDPAVADGRACEVVPGRFVAFQFAGGRDAPPQGGAEPEPVVLEEA
eukprot:CAMPEP_0172176274 /NCGR_PEP_ID=MMETSP1050-20130122/14706_1 /TAXON_ID=233186 /ORGANISM="Cryptomonas curvata, Strain CCAP979/52" /LENGTH=108 /DNA_ID=CAMNT_0012848497 /DNA_START=889 /DNA_END=1211 /DNA_ORIENTATION=-